MAYSSYSRRPPAGSKINRRLLFYVVILLIIGGAVYWFLLKENNTVTPSAQQTNANNNDQPETPPYTAPDLQPEIDAWADRQSADYHIQIYDLQAGKVIGQIEPDEVLFAASLYKIYIAYLSLKDFESGAQDPDEVILAGQTRRQCVDKMIRSSDSPCGETMMADIGQAALNQRVKSELGTTGTTFNGIQTSASDSILVLKAIADKKDLNDENTAFLLDAMLTQDAKFKRGLQAGAPEAKWETKVGWNLDVNYHDIGIMTLPDGREFAVAILGQGSGSPAPIADFAKTLFTALTQ
jgi:beta-lactamase class A